MNTKGLLLTNFVVGFVVVLELCFEIESVSRGLTFHSQLKTTQSTT